MATNDFGVTFAPTADQAELAKRRQGLEGVPQALQILSLHMPRFLGAQAPVNSALTSPTAGAQGMDPYGPALSAVLASIARTLSAPQGGMFPPERPERPFPTSPNPTAPYYVPGLPPSAPAEPPIPATHWMPAPGRPPVSPGPYSGNNPQGAPQNFRRREFGG